MFVAALFVVLELLISLLPLLLLRRVETTDPEEVRPNVEAAEVDFPIKACPIEWGEMKEDEDK